jgi:argininosuccinate lyase
MRKGRFNKPAAKIAQRYGESVSFDWRLYGYDITGSIAHAAALAQAGIITTAGRRKIEKGLRAIEKEIESGKFKWDRSVEDVHMNVEAALTDGLAPQVRNCIPRAVGTIRSHSICVFTSKRRSRKC